MNRHLITVQTLLQQNSQLSEQDKEALIKAIADADKQWSVTDLKLDRTKKVKKTTSILLKETIAELEQKRKAVEAQNRELEIETALERVRVIAMEMKAPADMLDVCRMISQQLDLLNVKQIRNVQTAIFNQKKGTYLNYEFFRLHDKTTISEVEYNLQPDVKDFVNQMLTNPEAFFTTAFEGTKLKDWMEYQEKANQFVDPHLCEVGSVHYYFYSIGPGALGVSAYAPLNDNELAVFRRFRNVFALAYRRFIDIEQAIAQALEAKIETALEKVRSRSLAMHKSDELQEVVNTVFDRLTGLNIEMDSANIAIFKEGTRDYDYWVASHFQKRTRSFHMPYTELLLTRDLIAARESGTDFSAKAYSFEEKNQWFNYAFTNTDFKFLTKERKQFILNAPAVTVSIAFSRYTGLQVTRYSTKLLSEREAEILKRFSKVFEQAYIRFLDLQKAEAQARDAQIEAALERVRAKVMAMNNSKELNETSLVFGEQLRKLGIDWQFSYFWLIEEDKDENTFWITWPDNKTSTTTYSLAEADEGFKECMIAWREQVKVHSTHIPIQGVQAWLDTFERITNDADGMAVEIMKPANFRDGVYYYDAMIRFGSFGILMNRAVNDEEKNIQSRFATEFERAYSRFLDLKNAEVQARESQIQLALERVRARTMAMQRSDELKNAAALLFQQVKSLGAPAYSCGYNIWEKNDTTFTSWMSTQDGSIINGVPSIPLTEDANFIRYVESKQKGEQFFVLELRGERMQEHYQYLKTIPAFKAYFDYAESVGFDLPETQIHYLANFSHGNLLFITLEPCPEYHDVFKRFAAVFEQTYTRFLDLQRAEAQAREAQIETALERVRSRTMAMQKSEELSDVATVLFQQVKSLGVPQWTCGFCIWDIGDTECMWYPGSPGPDGETLAPSRFPLTGHPVFRIMDESRKRGDELYIYEKEGELQADHYRYMMTLPGIRESLQDMLDAGLTIPTFQIDHYANFAYGNLIFITYEHFPEMHDIFKRFAKVFEQTYTRFLDLQKAEAQAREAQIETSLERVRSRTMAMHNSQDVGETVATLFDEFVKLGIETFRCGIGIIHQEQKMEVWTARRDPNGKVNFFTGFMDMTMHPMLQGAYSAWKKKQESYLYELKGDDLKEYFSRSNNNPNYPLKYDIPSLPSRLIFSVFYFPEGFLFAFTLEELSAGATKIFKRFSGVFGQTYRRYLDLQKAEAQVRESQIEAALERVRSRSMGMQKSEELKEVIQVVYEQFVVLNIHIEHTGFVMDYKTRDDYNIWVADPLGVPSQVTVPYFDSVYYNRFNEAKKNGEDFFATNLSFEEKNKFYQKLFEYIPGLPEEAKEFYFSCAGLAASTVLLDNVCLYIENFSGTPYSDEENATLMRFGKVFQQTYTRFLDLQKAEAQAREAIKQASVDRIRAEIASMRTTSDLERIQPLIWNELKTLGVPFTRCGVFIMDEEHEHVDTFLSTPEGRSIASFTSNYSDVAVISGALPYWRRKEIYKAHWDEATFLAQAKMLLEQGNIMSTETYLTEHRPKDLYLHFLPFLQGILYVGNETPLNDDELQLVQNLADAFSIAYARYEDFNKLEAAKQQVDKTLVELKQAQTQLVQSEKMASLGELTAGIAHEIQNPLNFVNNFSDVSNELLEEMKAELQKGNAADAIAIADDVRMNLEKIVHHGKRADAIVKGMLQHSRISSGQKELTDINALADEYLRLAYHGLRAKDKTFNAKFETGFDNSIGQINIIPQDIGRVLVNLINNAFYSVTEKRKNHIDAYEPAVSITTKKIAGKIELKVIDNGNGIPQKVLDKIFQPFFTTKPTGQGTGLGLSLSYDIVKAHGGEIKVQTTEGEGTEFIIQLPVV